MTAKARPTIHLNGSSAAELLAALQDAHAAMRAAMLALRATAPHGRDYYTQGPDAYPLARNEHQERADALFSVAADLEAIACTVQKAQDDRRARAAR